MCQFIKAFLEGKWSLILSLVMITGGYTLSQLGFNTLFYQYLAKEGQNISILINQNFPIFDEISTTINHMSPIYQFKHLFGLDHEEQPQTFNVEIEFIPDEQDVRQVPKMSLPGDDIRQITDMDRIPTADGWGQYKMEDLKKKFEMEKKIEAPQDLDEFNLELQKKGITLDFGDKELMFKKDKNGKVWDGFKRTIGWWESKPMTWDEQAKLAFKKGGKLLTNVEAQALLKWAGGPIMKQDAWVATYRVVDNGHKVVKDWIQIGVHQCGVGCSHIDTYGYPVWGDKPAKGWNTMMMAFNMKK